MLLSPILVGLLFVAASWPLLVCGEPPVANKTASGGVERPSGGPLVSGFRSLQAQMANNEQWLLSALAELFQLGANEPPGKKGEPGKEGGGGGDLLEQLFARLSAAGSKGQDFESAFREATRGAPATPKPPPATTTTTRPAEAAQRQQLDGEEPLRQISRGLESLFAQGTSGVKMLETPLKVFGNLLNSGAESAQTAANGLAATSKVASTVGDVLPTVMAATAGAAGAMNAASGMGGMGGGGGGGVGGNREEERNRRGRNGDGSRTKFEEDDWKYYEFSGPQEPYAYRRPKYFSRECHFRFACEVGKLTRTLTGKISRDMESNRFLQDLHNRYTRAMTYGGARGNCERYYCVLVKMLGGPVGFASGVTEIVNRALNSDLYSDYQPAGDE